MKRLLLCLMFSALFLFGCKETEQKTNQVSGEVKAEKSKVVVSDENPVKIGFMVCNSPMETTARFAPIAAYLTQKTGRKFDFIIANTHEFEDLIRDKKIDFFHGNSLLAVTFKEKYKMEFLAVDKRGKNGHKSTGTIIALKSSGIKTYEDMRGKTMVFGPALAPFGYMVQYDLMMDHGIDPEEDLGYYAIPWGSAKHDKVIYGVLYGKYDLGAAPRIDVDLMVEDGKINLDDFVIIDESEPMPYCTVGALQGVDKALAEKVKQALLTITPDDTVEMDGEVIKVLKAAWLDGWAEAVDSEYDIIREKMKKLNMDPYKQF